jgi:SpoVK/Ycf46/Vps4 family AAA+-type ATPase
MVRKKKTKGSAPQSNNVDPIVASSAASSSLPQAHRSLSFSASKSVTATLTPTVAATADVLCVGLSKSKVSTGTSTKGGGGRGGISRRYLPRVFLSEQDASNLDILPDEDVIVLRRSSSDNKASFLLGGALICKALVSKRSSSLQSPTRTSYSSQSRASSSVVAVGSIQIQPSDMLNLLLAPAISDNSMLGFSKRTVICENHAPAPATPVTPATPVVTAQQATSQTTPEPNNSFSFQIGGGGDALYSSASPSSSSIRKTLSSSSSKAAFYSNDRFWILPLESSLGSCVAQQIINNNNNNDTLPHNGPCYRIHLEPLRSASIMEQQPSTVMIENDNAGLVPRMAIPSNATRILERIILATYIGRFVQAREIVRVTFQGKLLQLQITRIETIESTTTTTLTLADDDDDNKSIKNHARAASDHEILITEEFEKLALDIHDDGCNNDKRSSEDAKQLLQQLSCFRTTKRLYKVTYETKIAVTVTSSLTTMSSNLRQSENDCSDAEPNHQQQRAIGQHVVGLSSVMKQVHDLLWTPLTRPELFMQTEFTTAGTAIKAPRGILLHGPSGVGKSSLARQVAAELEASSCSCEVLFVDCILLQAKTTLVGQAEQQLSKYFQPSKQQQQQQHGRPKLLIFDDIHLICPRRGGGGFTDQLASTLLALLDGIESSSSSSSSSASGLRHNNEAVSNKAASRSASPVVILAITSNPSLLDPALRRPGRLDVEVEVPIPDEPSTRAEILRFHVMLKTAWPGPLTVPAMTSDDWLMLGKLAKGFTGADCMLAVKQAVRTALFRRLHLSAQSTSPQREHATSVEFHDLASAIRATKPSSIKSITVEIPRVPWASIGGMDDVKRELREAIELPLTHGDLFQRLGVPPPRGILLYGPPGCSKTLMARALATEGQMNFLSVKGPELLSKWLGESERALASLFRRARMASPSIIFFDEIDAIASARGSGDSAGGGGRLLSQLLTELDGVVYTNSSSAKKSSKSNRVVVVGATNRPDLLDRALTRPGRIDRMIYVGVPDTESRRQIFEVTLTNKSCDSDIDLAYLSQDEVSKGYSGAEIVAICQDAALFALEETDDSPAEEVLDHKSPAKVSMRHLLKASKGMQRQITPEMLDFYATYQNNTSNNI